MRPWFRGHPGCCAGSAVYVARPMLTANASEAVAVSSAGGEGRAPVDAERRPILVVARSLLALSLAPLALVLEVSLSMGLAVRRVVSRQLRAARAHAGAGVRGPILARLVRD